MIGIILLIGVLSSALLLAYAIYRYLEDHPNDTKSEPGIKPEGRIMLVKNQASGTQELQLRDGTRVTLSPTDVQRLSQGIVNVEQLEAEYISYRDIR